MEKLNLKGSSLIHKRGMEEERQFLGLLDISLNRLAAILHLHLPGGVQGWVYEAESVFIIFNSFFLSFFLNRRTCFSSFFYIPRDM